MKPRRRRFLARTQPCWIATADGAPAATETLENRSLLSNLAISDAFLVDGNNARINRPLQGEQVEIRSLYSTNGLSVSESYAIRFIVDGIAVDKTDLTFGTGTAAATENWFADMFHGYAEAGSHTVQVVLDPFNQIVETNETDNSRTFTFTPAQATNLPQKLRSVVEGTAGVDWRVMNFADLDPRPGFLRDYRGGKFTYDTPTFGHDAIDIGLADFSAADVGMPVLAAADGLVEAVNDGAFDRNKGFAYPEPPANYVILNLGNNWRAKYWHLRKDSVSVKVGDSIAAGDFLGWTGSSGFSTGPHVHFELTYKNHPVETMLDPATFWVTPPQYPADYRHVIKSGFSSNVPTASEWAEQPQDIRTFKPGNRLSFWVIAGAMMPGDTRTVRLQRPDGSLFLDQTSNPGSTFFQVSQWAYTVTLPTTNALGTWTATWLQNGVELTRKTFTVSNVGVPELRVELGGELIPSARFTPIDFGSSLPGSAGQIRTFDIRNFGSALLSLSSVTVPTGYEIVSYPTTILQPGQSATLAVRLKTTAQGYFAGELRLATNDSDESVYRVWLEGIVAPAGVGTLIPGLSVRKAAEGSRFFANIRRIGNLTSDLTVSLSTDKTELIVPSTVTIPAGAAFINFEVQAVQDQINDGDQRVSLRASAAGLHSGQNEILVLDALPGTPEPAAPRIIGPSTAVLNSPVNFSWTPVSNASSYDVRIDFLSGTTANLIRRTVTQTSLSIAGLAALGRYRVLVRANLSTGGSTTFSSGHLLNVDSPIALNPLAETQVTARPKLSWSKVPTAIRYEFQIDDILRLKSFVVTSSSSTVTSLTLPNPLPMGMYQVRVRGVDVRSEKTSWSPAISFTVVTVPTTTITPLSTFDSTPALQWSAVLGARSYEVVLRDSKTGAAIYQASEVRLPVWTTPADLPVGNYTWQVRASAEYGVQSAWSTARNLTVGGQPQMLAPLNASAGRVTFRWDPVQFADRYELRVVGESALQTDVLRVSTIRGNAKEITQALPVGAYRVWLRAFSPFGEPSAWSIAIRFVVS
ncbi:MAG: peptidoglycan DD-metalloendopeptidase family protein [Planctomycetaceae bacterium]